MDDEDDRTTAFGLFNFAHTYWASAAALRKIKVKATHPEDPQQYLYCHAVELFLKAYLRAKGASATELREKYRHKLVPMGHVAAKEGLLVDDEVREVLELIDGLGTTLRYIRQGAFRMPTFEALERTCKSFHQCAAELLMSQGHKIRYYRRS